MTTQPDIIAGKTRDAMKTITVNVTQEDIDKGKALDCEECPLALAMSRAIGQRVMVSPDLWCLKNGMEMRLPAKAIAFRWKTDFGMRVYPVSFTVEVP